MTAQRGGWKELGDCVRKILESNPSSRIIVVSIASAVPGPLIVMLLAVAGSDVVVEVARSAVWYSFGSLVVGLGVYVLRRRRE